MAASAAFTLLGSVQVTLIGAITVITVALPAIGRDLHLGESGLVLLSSGYGISFGGLLPAGGRLADRFGNRRAFVTGTAVFGLASAGAGLAPWAGLLAAARLAEGAGAALAAPSAAALLGAVFPDPGRHGKALATRHCWGSAGWRTRCCAAHCSPACVRRQDPAVPHAPDAGVRCQGVTGAGATGTAYEEVMSSYAFARLAR